jgi:predicted transcriptional regulator
MHIGCSILTLAKIPDKIEFKIIMAISDISKTVSQICSENNLPQSSTYKKIKRLLNTGLIIIERVSIGERDQSMLIRTK